MDQETANNQQPITPEPFVNQPITVPVSPTPQPKSKLPLILGILVLLGIVGGLGVLGGKYLFGGKTETAQPIVTVTTTTPTPDLTANWKTYTTIKYLFKYPDGWVVSKTDYLNSIQLINTNKTVSITISESQYPYGFGNEAKIDKKDLQLTVNGKIYNVKENIVNNSEAFVDFKIDDSKNYYVLFGTGYPGGFGGKTSLTDFQNSLDIIFQILSTFKLLGQNQTNDTTSWKTFSNSDLAFQYPSTWTVSENSSTITSPDSKMRISIASKDIGLMNECMKEISATSQGNVIVKKFSRVNTGEMCSTTDPADLAKLEAWIIPNATAYSPGINFQYSTAEKTQAETILNQIITTFRFL